MTVNELMPSIQAHEARINRNSVKEEDVHFKLRGNHLSPLEIVAEEEMHLEKGSADE